MDDIDHERTDEIVCPHCGYEFENSWEFNGDHGETECNECFETFSFERIHDISYTTTKIEKLEEVKP